MNKEHNIKGVVKSKNGPLGHKIMPLKRYIVFKFR